ncbi:PEP-CTERM sorting domain-containing protein [Massilia cavernae]|uniref:PEP-CTERM sorting domain-containing protein n=1 Tax=Massilia cavernae TaxID=2320864 RepID=A0A418Y7H6_9BURK|nr:PEP-CTERM sorting domain-containing protein [Massilia cavernae]RJG25864.1 PEP-CTERM sorting domain-containing protein [Massilia cavernae]
MGLLRRILTKEKIMLKCTTVGLLVSFTLLCLAPHASATVVSGTSSSYGESANLTLTPLIGLPFAIGSGPVPTAGGSAPAPYNDSDSVAQIISLPLSAFLQTVNASSNVDGAPGSRFADADATVLNLSALLGLLTAQVVQSTAAVSGDFGALSSVGTSNLEGLMVNGMPFIVASPAPNTPLFSAPGLTVTLNEQIHTGDGINSLGLAVNAIHIAFNNFAHGLGLINGDIIISHSEALLTAIPNNDNGQVPEPGTLLLLAGGMIGFMAMGRRRPLK